jgi:hypothetical protein
MLITKIRRTDTTRAELYGARHRYPDLRLFDLSDLSALGLDLAALPIGQETPVRFWAIYELSDKTNKAGNPYKDVIALEPMDKPATVTSTAVGDPAILSELRRIVALLEATAKSQGVAVPPLADPAEEHNGEEGERNGSDLDAAFPRYRDGSSLSDSAAEAQAWHDYRAAHQGQAPENIDTLRGWVREGTRRLAGRS